MPPARALLVLPLAAALLLGACGDPEPERQAEPTAPAAPAAALTGSDASLEAAATGVGPSSSVCRAYQRKREKIGALVAKSPGDQKLRDQVQALNAMIRDACS